VKLRIEPCVREPRVNALAHKEKRNGYFGPAVKEGIVNGVLAVLVVAAVALGGCQRTV
jgi:hypothetical protein